MPAFDVDAITLEHLSRRRSAKWRHFAPDVLPAWIAEMDFPLAEPIARTLRTAIDNSDTGYLWPGELGEAFSTYAKGAWGWQVSSERVLSLPDVLTGVAQSLLHLTAPGDGVVINPPVYHPFFSSITDVVHRTVVEAPMKRAADGRYDWDLDAMEAAFARPDVTAYLMSNPHNPTGTVASAETLSRIAELSTRFDVAVIADEIHAPLTLPGAEHVPYLTVAGDDANAVCLISASKAWNIPGLKCSQLVSTDRTARTVLARIPMEVTYGSGHLGAIAAVSAYRDGGPWLADVIDILDGNRRLLAELIADEMPRAWYRPPDASYLAWLDLRAYYLGEDPAAILVEHAKVALSSGPLFGAAGSGFVRLNFATSPDILREIVRRIAAVVQ